MKELVVSTIAILVWCTALALALSLIQGCATTHDNMSTCRRLCHDNVKDYSDDVVSCSCQAQD